MLDTYLTYFPLKLCSSKTISSEQSINKLIFLTCMSPKLNSTAAAQQFFGPLSARYGSRAYL